MTKKLKMLAVCPIDLDTRGGCTPMFWQLFRELAELNVEIIVIPAYGKGFSSLWWKYYPNPIPDFSFQNSLVQLNNKLTHPFQMKQHHDLTSIKAGSKSRNHFRTVQALKQFRDQIFSKSYQSSWIKSLDNIWKKEKDIDAFFIFNDMFHYLKWLPEYIKKRYHVPLVGYSADLPTYLWRENIFRLSPFYDVHLNGYDAFIVNSKGVTKRLEELGASHTYVLNFAADPALFAPFETKKDVDVSFYSYGSNLREDAINYMITQPSRKLKNANFATAGSYDVDLGLSKSVGNLTFARMKNLCFRTKINLNITRKTFAETYCSSTARIFELAAMQCCIVSNPYVGIEEWFTVGKELFIAHDEAEAIELYTWLLSADELRNTVSERARQRVCREHTYKHRAQDFLAIAEEIVKRA